MVRKVLVPIWDGQRAGIAAKALPLLKDEAKERQRLHAGHFILLRSNPIIAFRSSTTRESK
jgi:hypothetical protein